MGDIGYCQSGIGFPEREQGRKKGIPFYKVSDMTLIGNELIMVTSNNYVSEEQILNNRWKVINSIPAIIFAKVGAALLLDRKRLVLNSFLIDNNIMAYILNEEWDYYFCKTLFDTIYLPQLSQIGALPSFNVKDVENLNVIIPKSKEEQTVIGNFFKQLDDTIALHRRNCVTFQNLKTAYLENIFSAKYIQNKDKNKNAWEQRKLGAVLKIKSGMSQKNIEDPTGVYPILATGGEIGRTNTFIYNRESVLIGRKGTINRPYYMNTPFWTVDTLFYSELSENISGLFIYNLFQTIDWMSYDTSTGVPSLTSSAIHNINVYLPKSKEEQTAIGNFFKQLDDTIALHQRFWVNNNQFGRKYAELF